MDVGFLTVFEAIEKIGIGNVIAVWLLFKTSQQLQENNKMMSEIMKQIEQLQKEMHESESFYKSGSRSERNS